MKNQDIIEEILESKIKGKLIPSTEIENKLLLMGIEKSSINELTIKLDNELTACQLIHAQKKKSKAIMILGAIIGILGIIMTILSLGGVIFEGVTIIFYGAIGGGIAAAVMSKNNMDRCDEEYLKRKSKWENLLR